MSQRSKITRRKNISEDMPRTSPPITRSRKGPEKEREIVDPLRQNERRHPSETSHRQSEREHASDPPRQSERGESFNPPCQSEIRHTLTPPRRSGTAVVPDRDRGAADSNDSDKDGNILSDQPSGQTTSGITESWKVYSDTSETENYTHNSTVKMGIRGNNGGENSKKGHEKPTERNSEATLVERSSPRASGTSRASSAAARRRAELEIRMEIERRKMEEARAGAELAKAKLELIHLEEEEEENLTDETSDGESELQNARTAEWIRKSMHGHSTRQLTIVETKPPEEPSRETARKEPLSWPAVEPQPSSHSKTPVNALMNNNRRQQTVGPPTHAPPYTPAPRFKCELLPFDGNLDDWVAFRATYLDTEEYFTPIENVTRLRNAVQGKARTAIKAQLYQKRDPREILHALEVRYGKTSYLMKNEITTLEKLPAMQDDGRNVMLFASAVANAVSTIEHLNKPHLLQASDLSDRVVSKMSDIVRFQWFAYKRTMPDVPIMVGLMHYLEVLAEQMESYDTICDQGKKKEYVRNKPRASGHVHVTTVEDGYNKYDSDSDEGDRTDDSEESHGKSANSHGKETVAILSSKKEKEIRKCPLCDKDHGITKCVLFTKANINERWELAKKAKACFRCLRTNHRGFNCKAKGCGKGDCTRGHHIMLHEDRVAQPEAKDTKKITSVNALCATKAYLKIAPVELTGPAGTIQLYALLDEGSTVTLLEDEIADKIGAKGPAEELNIEGVGGAKMKESSSRRLNLRIKGLYSRNYEDITTLTIGRLELAPQAIQREELSECPHIQDMISDLTYDYAKPSLLIGQDNWHLIVSREIKSGDSSKPVASRTKLGWVLHGCNSNALKPVRTVNYVCEREGQHDALDSLMREHFSIESLGIAPRKPVNDPEQRALNLLENTCKRLPEARYEVGLLWKSDNERMPESRQNAIRRLVGIERKMNKNIDFKNEYTKQVTNLIESGYAEPIDTAPTSPRTWYLPHFAVVHPQKKKMRLVFDAAARSGGKCLNDALLPGPDLLQSLFGVLMRFREGPIAVVSDIKEMFLRVKIREEDRDSLRFLWRESKDHPLKEYRMSSLIFGATSSPCTAIFVKNHNAEAFKDQYPEAVKAIERNHYMDDYLQSFHNKEEATEIAKQVDAIHLHAGFELRGWACNEPSVITVLTADQGSVGNVPLGGQKDQIEKTLGLRWNIKEDCLNFTLNLRNTPLEAVEGERAPTKREATSAVMSVFDPLGLAAPIIVQGKMMLQSVWRTGVEWDEPLQNDEEKQWRDWLSELKKLTNLNIPRCITHGVTDGELHTFCDASEKAYAAAVYWRVQHNEHVEITLLAGKSRVTPLKPVSIPRLELQASLLGSRLASSIERELENFKITKKIYWTDSRTVLAWIKSDPRTFKPFVAHRLAEIEELTKPKEWRWVPTAHNVADDATRAAPPTFGKHHRWFIGPDFLYDHPRDWPEDKSEKILPPTGEEKCTIATARKVPIAEYPAPERFSKWTRLLRAVARFLQCVDTFKSNVKKNTVCATKRTIKDTTWRKYSNKKAERAKQQHYQPKTKREGERPVDFIPLDEKYLKSAETLLIKTVQHDCFHNDINRIKNNENLEKGSRLRRLTVELHEDIIHLSTRVGAASYLNDDYKRPVVLDGKHPLTKLLIEEYHRKFNHGNYNTVMNELRQRFYITSLRPTIRSIAHSCLWCRMHRNTPQMAPLGDLPPERLLKNQFPFTCTAVDYFGPMHITVARRHEKRWGALFTCLTTRAVHLELATSLSTDSMILALRRLTARRGSPKVIYSDNGTNFCGANKELKDEIENMNKVEIAFAAESRGIQWKFIPPGAPHMGGSWERMVRSVKTALAATLKERYPKEEILHTLLLEAEHIVNSRPLTDVSLDPDDKESLTPNHFLIGRSHGAPLLGEFDDHTLIGSATWRTAQRLTDHFWTRWTKEYLPTLSPRYHNHQAFTNPQIGDIVLIVDSSLPRGTWPRGEITNIHTGPDGRVRVVDVRTGAGVLRRPTSRLVIITSTGPASSLHETEALRTDGETVDDDARCS